MFEDLRDGLLEAIENEKGNMKLTEVKNDKLPARTFVVDATENLSDRQPAPGMGAGEI